MLKTPSLDLILVGGGLANTLIAYRLIQRRPDLSFVLLEPGPHLGGTQFWSFHETDLTRTQTEWVAPLVSYWWPDQTVFFAGYQRILGCGYRTIASSDLYRAAAALFPERIRLGIAIRKVTSDHVELSDGSTLSAGKVIDARGVFSGGRVAYQKSLGQVVRLKAAHGVVTPILMDALCEQLEGYRYFYVLPLGEDRLLIQDARYSSAAEMDLPALRRAIAEYARARDWAIAEVLSEEAVAVPIPLDSTLPTSENGVLSSGLPAGLFHPSTGNLLPAAVRFADFITASTGFNELSGYQRRQWESGKFFRLLNRLLILAARPETRYRVFERFYTLPDDLVSRFYRGKLSFGDRCRLLLGRPPVPIRNALAVLRERHA